MSEVFSWELMMIIVKENELNIDSFTKLLIQKGVYSLYSLENKEKYSYAIKKAFNKYILLDLSGKPVIEKTELVEKKELVSLEKSIQSVNYNYNN